MSMKPAENFLPSDAVVTARSSLSLKETSYLNLCSHWPLSQLNDENCTQRFCSRYWSCGWLEEHKVRHLCQLQVLPLLLNHFFKAYSPPSNCRRQPRTSTWWSASWEASRRSRTMSFPTWQPCCPSWRRSCSWRPKIRRSRTITIIWCVCFENVHQSTNLTTLLMFSINWEQMAPKINTVNLKNSFVML